MRPSLVLCLLLVGCHASSEHKPDFCGTVGPTSVYVAYGNAFVFCKEARETTAQAYELLQEVAGPLERPWTIEYTWTFVGMDLQGETSPQSLRIRVREMYSAAVFHEMLHAYLFEHPQGDHHSKMCGYEPWRRAENNFVGPMYYCFVR